MNIIEQSVIEGQYTVKLAKFESGYSVIYGKQVTTFGAGAGELQNALNEYNDCVVHQMGCAGWMDDEDL